MRVERERGEGERKKERKRERERERERPTFASFSPVCSLCSDSLTAACCSCLTSASSSSDHPSSPPSLSSPPPPPPPLQSSSSEFSSRMKLLSLWLPAVLIFNCGVKVAYLGNFTNYSTLANKGACYALQCYKLIELSA